MTCELLKHGKLLEGILSITWKVSKPNQLGNFMSRLAEERQRISLELIPLMSIHMKRLQLFISLMKIDLRLISLLQDTTKKSKAFR